MKLNRKYITPFIAIVFLVVALTGTLMFFHVFDGFTEVVHEFLGISFVGFAMTHIVVNWPSLKMHFGKNVFIPAAIFISVLSMGIVISERINVPIDMVLINKLTTAPLEDAFKVLDIEYSEASNALKEKGIVIGGSQTLEDIWNKNDVSPEEVIDVLVR